MLLGCQHGKLFELGVVALASMLIAHGWRIDASIGMDACALASLGSLAIGRLAVVHTFGLCQCRRHDHGH